MTKMVEVRVPNGFSIRRIQKQDYEGVIKTLSILTTVGAVTEKQFGSIVEYWDTQKLPKGDVYKYNPYVIVEDSTGKVAATGNVIIEQKLIHECGLVGHIEDIAVGSEFQGKKLGALLINKLTEVGLESGCYKIILDCDPKNVAFYEKCGFHTAGVEMQIKANL
ncbi:hypothetical protein Kpol_1011p10 [Vanderwaltozyma polyspora DSM 70294]|uniref:Glucosamine 6-phosphate N-acetyltransferase n=1 Tax=Vanderwaltozyma polyspora (strain ATCC 22028 / DSM 70294 / BCRC 21397 / CBS 2163 / NBRC 10782 / NRRL Y-8283 / UCD 57-17) TaxID=436907 RepID=A7TQW7_VANPO|nr:uncharacterized protein Kpol_1011p10 [Vanderwaltozyma polyspora DSM 70294]EDO15340.1 hypothetical protein Kpol_1011p10 [Vanderwaltozyma polyspora DSM 70294]